MSLYKPFFAFVATEQGEYKVRHNHNGALNFITEEIVDEKTANLIQLALEEGKRARSKEIAGLLNLERM